MLFFKMSYRQTKEAIGVSYTNDVLNLEEIVLLYGVNKSKNPNFPY